MNFTLRPWATTDKDSLLKYADNFNIARFMTDAFPHPYTADNADQFLERVCAATPTNVLAIDIYGEAVGSIGIFPQADIMRMNAELGYWLGEPFWGRGIMPRAVALMIEYAFSTFPRITRIYARPYSNNPASRRVLEKAGFILEAHIKDNIIKNGEVLDELIFAVRRPA
jgi:ribosomal-protein-alanine N-acetyltransferase